MDIIVTTPKSEMAHAAQEAADVLAAGGGLYFRRFLRSYRPRDVRPGSWVYYVEDGYLRGRCQVVSAFDSRTGLACGTTGRQWPDD